MVFLGIGRPPFYVFLLQRYNSLGTLFVRCLLFKTKVCTTALVFINIIISDGENITETEGGNRDEQVELLTYNNNQKSYKCKKFL